MTELQIHFLGSVWFGDRLQRLLPIEGLIKRLDRVFGGNAQATAPPDRFDRYEHYLDPNDDRASSINLGNRVGVGESYMQPRESNPAAPYPCTGTFVDLHKIYSATWMRPRLCLLYVLALLAVAFSPLPVVAQIITDAQELPPDNRTAFLNGIREQNSGNLVAALRLYQQVHRQFPLFVPALFNMGLIYDQQGLTEKALDCFGSIAAHSPDYPNLNLFIGIEETKNGNARAALAPLSSAAKQSPQDKTAWFWLARARLMLKDDVAAMNAARMASSIAVNDPSVLFLIARIYMDQQDWRGGAATLNQILRDHPDLPGIHEALGTCYFMQDEFDSAMAQYNDELAIDPTNGKASAMVGLIYCQRGNFQSAIPYLKSALQQNSNVIYLQIKLSRALWSVGNIDEAVIHAQLAEKLDPENTDAHYILLRLYRQLGRTADAKRELEMFQKLTQK